MEYGGLLLILFHSIMIRSLQASFDADFWSFINKSVRLYEREKLYAIANGNKQILRNYLFFGTTLLLVGVSVFGIYLWMLTSDYKDNQMKRRTKRKKKKKKKLKPKQMKCAVINLKEFTTTKPLMHMRDFRGEIRHALDKEKSMDLAEIAFDPAQNEITAIGSQIDLFDTSQRRTETVEEPTKSLYKPKSQKKLKETQATKAASINSVHESKEAATSDNPLETTTIKSTKTVVDDSKQSAISDISVEATKIKSLKTVVDESKLSAISDIPVEVTKIKSKKTVVDDSKQSVPSALSVEATQELDAVGKITTSTQKSFTDIDSMLQKSQKSSKEEKTGSE